MEIDKVAEKSGSVRWIFKSIQCWKRWPSVVGNQGGVATDTFAFLAIKNFQEN